MRPRHTPSTIVLAAAGVAGLAAMVLLAENAGAGLLNAMTLRLPGIDKVLHFIQAGAVCYVLAVLLGRTPLSLPARVATAAGLALVLAGADEVQQSFRPDRNVELADIGAGAAGVAVAAAALARRRYPRAAVATAVAAVVACGVITHATYQRLRDYNRGLLAERQGQRDDALQHYLASIASGVENPEAYNAAAWLMAESPHGDFAQAVIYAEHSLRLRPRHADTLDTYGWALYRAGRAGEASLPLEQALAAKPDIYCIHYHLGIVYLETGRKDDGLRHLRQQIELMPNTREADLAADLLARLDANARRH